MRSHKCYHTFYISENFEDVLKVKCYYRCNYLIDFSQDDVYMTMSKEYSILLKERLEWFSISGVYIHTKAIRELKDVLRNYIVERIALDTNALEYTIMYTINNWVDLVILKYGDRMERFI